MSNFQMYHTLGQQVNDPNYLPPSTTQQQRSMPGQADHMKGEYDNYGNQRYLSTHGPEQSPPQGGTDTASLSSQMASTTLGEQGYSRSHKKKDRHAYHNLESTGGSQNHNSTSQSLNAAQSQFGGSGNGLASFAAPQQYSIPHGSNNSAVPQPMAFGNTPAPAVPTGSSISSSQGRVDPEQVPSIPRSRDGPATYYLDHIYPTIERYLPPPAAIPFVAYDQGNASPKHARLTLNNIPATSEALSATGIPLGLICQPFAPLQDGENPVPTLDFGEAGPPRCRRCRTYINSFMTFHSGGNKFVCNMCNFPNDVPSEYFAPTDPSGVRVDRAQRPELTTGTVEFLVPKEYWAKEPVSLRRLFLIDVSAEAINKGFTSAFCEGILKVLYQDSARANDEDGPNSSPQPISPLAGCEIGIVTFDREVHFYNLASGLEQAQMMVMPDVEDPFVALGEGLFVHPRDSKEIITSLLTRIPHMFAEVKNPEPALLSTLNAVMSALQNTGGKLICSISALSTWGQGRLFLRDDGKGQSFDTDKKLLVAENPAWRKTASKLVEYGIGVDFFMAAPSGGYLDIATIGKRPSFLI